MKVDSYPIDNISYSIHWDRILIYLGLDPRRVATNLPFSKGWRSEGLPFRKLV